MYSNLREKLSELVFFSPVMLVQLSDKKPTTVLQWLTREVAKGRMLRIKRGKYMLKEYYLIHKDDDVFVAVVANELEPNSYLSGAWILQKYGILSENVYKVTSITSKHAKIIKNQIANFVYSQIKTELFLGYKKVWSGSKWGYEATKAKALFDYFYEKKLSNQIRDDDCSIIESERLNLEKLSREEMGELESYVKIDNSPKMKIIVSKLKEEL